MCSEVRALKSVLLDQLVGTTTNQGGKVAECIGP